MLGKHSAPAERGVDEALAGNDELQQYVARIDQGLEGEGSAPTEAASGEDEPPTEIPSSDVVLRELEDFLRRSRQDAGADDDEDDLPGR